MSTTVGAGAAPTVRTLIVTAAVAPLHAEPRAGSEQVSQRLVGHFLEVLEERLPWMRVRGEDGYEGWAHAGYVRPIPESRGRPDDVRVSLGCTARTIERRRAFYPLGGYVTDIAYLESGEAIAAAELPRRFPRDAEALSQTALNFFEGTPYQWGGITPWGADCSGLVQTVFALHGLSLPRDASLQAGQGRDAGTDVEALQPADLLFFSDRADGRPTHVALALGHCRIAHSAIGRGGFAVDHLVPESRDPYVTALLSRFRFARRML